MKILFIYTNINGFHEDAYPFGLSSIMSMTKSQGHQVHSILVEEKKDYQKVLQEVKDFLPAIVGFSAVSSQFNFIKEIACLIRQGAHRTLLVCGGVHPTINPQCIQDVKELDAVFVGESEYAFVEFLEKVERGEPYQDVDNLAYMKDDQFVMNRVKPLIQDLDAVPFPDRDSVLFKKTLDTVGYAPFFFSRGCPYLCTYCSNHAIAQRYGTSRNRPRYRSPEYCIREVEDVVKEFTVNKIGIIDDIFGIDKKWREEFCRKYKQRVGVRFFCLLRANIIDEEFIKLLKDAGCYRISIGVESGNEYIRNKVMKRSMRTGQIIKAFDLCRKYGIQTNSLNIIGTPGETEEMIWDTIKLNRRLRPTSCGVNIFYPYKGTQLGDDCFRDNLVNEELYYSFSDERRSSVLNYSEEFKQRLVYYKENWDRLIFPNDFKRLVSNSIRKTSAWKHLRMLKQQVLSVRK